MPSVTIPRLTVSDSACGDVPLLPNNSNSNTMPNDDEAAPGGGGVAGTTADSNSHHRLTRFRNVKRIHDEYIFDETTDVIGSGAFSVVYRAMPHHHHHHNSNSNSSASTSSGAPVSAQHGSSEWYALKIIRRSRMSDTDKRQQRREVDREVCVLQHLHHSGCSRFVEALQTPDEYVIVMDLLFGCMDASRYLKERGPLSETHASVVIYQLFKTMEYLHRSFQILHRDIKLENIILSPVHVFQQEREGCSTGAAVAGATDSSSSSSSSMTSGVVSQRAANELDDGVGSSGAAAALITGGSVVSNTSAARVKCPGGDDNKREEAGEEKSPWSGLQNHHIDDPVHAFGKMTLVDFGLARWLRGQQQQSQTTTAASVQPAGGHHHSSAVQQHRSSHASAFVGGVPPSLLSSATTTTSCAAAVISPRIASPSCSSPVSPVMSSFMPSFSQPHQSPIVCPPSPGLITSAATDFIHVSCCGSDKYMAHEMLKWFMEHNGGGGGASRGAPSGGGLGMNNTVSNGRRVTTIEQAMKLDVYAAGVVSYVLLSGCLPYSGKTKALIAQQQATVPLKLSSQYWQHVSPEAKNFVSRLLTIDVSSRFSVEDALEHPWLRNARVICQKLSIDPHELHVTGHSLQQAAATTSHATSQTTTTVSSQTGAALASSVVSSSSESKSMPSSASMCSDLDETAVCKSTTPIDDIPPTSGQMEKPSQVGKKEAETEGTCVSVTTNATAIAALSIHPTSKHPSLPPTVSKSSGTANCLAPQA